MINLEFEKQSKPTPYIVCRNVFSPDFFQALVREFPSDEQFLEIKNTFGPGRDSRVIIEKGEEKFHAFLSQSPAWRTLFDYVNSEKFAASLVDVFQEELKSNGARFDRQNWKFDPTIKLRRRTLLQKIVDSHRFGISHVVTSLRHIWNVPRRLVFGSTLKVGFQLNFSPAGYGTEIHTDIRNKIFVLLVYLNETDGTGGEFRIHEHFDKKRPDEYERYPPPEMTRVVCNLKPRPNLGVVMLNCNNAYHSVTPLVNNREPRRFLYIDVEEKTPISVWPSKVS